MTIPPEEDGTEPLASGSHTHAVASPGESAPFHFTTHWRFPQPSERVWALFQDIGRWHEWWPGVSRSTTLNAEAVEASQSASRDRLCGGEGARAALIVRRPFARGLRIVLTVSGTQPPASARVEVTGDLRGHGHWRAVDDGGGCRVEIVWCVVTRMRFAALARWPSAWAHRRVMRGGWRGLRRRRASSATGEE